MQAFADFRQADGDTVQKIRTLPRALMFHAGMLHSVRAGNKTILPVQKNHPFRYC